MTTETTGNLFEEDQPVKPPPIPAMPTRCRACAEPLGDESIVFRGQTIHARCRYCLGCDQDVWPHVRARVITDAIPHCGDCSKGKRLIPGEAERARCHLCSRFRYTRLVSVPPRNVVVHKSCRCATCLAMFVRDDRRASTGDDVYHVTCEGPHVVN